MLRNDTLLALKVFSTKFGGGGGSVEHIHPFGNAYSILDLAFINSANN